MTILWFILVIGGIGLVFGIVLSLANKYLTVEEDPRIETVAKMLPQYNCGACGTPGCHAFAVEIVAGRAGTVKRCKPGKMETTYIPIIEYLKNNPNPDGTPVNIKI